MRILHTSDWHAGRQWKGCDRLPELQDILEHLGDFVERERIDLVLMSGDVFDSSTPPPEAERAVTAFFKRIGLAGVPSVVVAGNHDSPARLEAWGMLAELVRVHARGLPRRAADGGVIDVATASGERARIVALPFAPPGRLVTALTLVADETAARQKYADCMQRLFAQLSAGFAADTVNLVVAHSDISGAVSSGSERVATLGEDWAATPQALPDRAQYVALGHIHRPQPVRAARAPAHYAGSPMQLDFGEIGETKSFVVVEVEPGLPARVSCVHYRGARELGDFEGTWPELEARADELRRVGYLRVTIHHDTPDPELNRRARRLLPNIVAVHAPPAARGVERSPAPSAATAPPRQHYAAFYQRAHGRAPSDPTIALFDELYAAAAEDGE